MAMKEIDIREVKENLVHLLADEWALVTAGRGDALGTMTVSWGGIGERLCGSKSGREINKVEATGLTPCYYEKAPYFEEAKLVLVCRKVAVSAFEPSQFLDSGIMQNYAQNDFHAIYYGAIEKVLISE